ncbi:MAG: sarcosine oxidase subunit gamma [Alphaproteobacteria bacterium]|nr:sarcosine oxidase subunit gamma [Alphaproteobacteria bacterium]
MVELAERRSALAEVYETGSLGAEVAGEPGVTLAERRPLSIVHVAGKIDDKAFVDGVKKACGCDLPTEPCTVSSSGDLSIAWLGPTRWLAVAPDRGPGVLESALRDTCGDSGAIIDVSHGRTVIRIAGPNARDVLMKGAPLDFHAKVFTPGRVAQSAISQCGVVLVCVADDAFDLYVFRGFGQHMWEWVNDAAAEYGCTVTECLPD